MKTTQRPARPRATKSPLRAAIEQSARRLGIADPVNHDQRCAREYLDLGFRAGVRFARNTYSP